MPKTNLFLAFFVLTLAGLACQSSVLGVPVATPTPEATVTSSPAPTATVTSAHALRSGSVCFQEDIANGTLRIRECPGLACREVGILGSGDWVAATGERKDIDGATWMRIASPVEGWVNSRYVCEAK